MNNGIPERSTSPPPEHYIILERSAFQEAVRKRLTQKLQFTKYPGRNSDRKSLTAAPLWSAGYQGGLDIFIQKKYMS